MDDVTKLLPWGFLFLGVALLAGEWVTIARQRAWIANARRTDGVVLAARCGGYEEFDSVDVEYEDESGQAFRDTFRGSCRRVGDRTSVLYDPGSPYDARLGDFLELWGVAYFIVGGIGLSFAGLGGLLVALDLGWRRGPRESPAGTARPDTR